MPEFVRRYPAFIASLVLIFGGGLLAWLVQTGVGSIEVRDVRFLSPSGATLSALLYVPDTASADHPAPAVLAVHGYINSRETQSPYAIEFARRGYVVLALDQRGHGFSDPPAFAEGFGGPAALAHLRSLPMVDTDQVVLAGHSMGGWTVLTAAAQMPDAYQSVVVSGSSTGTFGVPAGDATFPRNFGLVFGRYDEFSGSMWSSATGAGIVETDKLKAQLGISDTVEVKGDSAALLSKAPPASFTSRRRPTLPITLPAAASRRRSTGYNAPHGLPIRFLPIGRSGSGRNWVPRCRCSAHSCFCLAPGRYYCVCRCSDACRGLWLRRPGFAIAAGGQRH